MFIGYRRWIFAIVIGLVVVFFYGPPKNKPLPQSGMQSSTNQINSKRFVEPQPDPPGYAEYVRRKNVLDSIVLDKRSYTGRSNDPLTANITFINKNDFTIKDFTVLFMFHGNSGTMIGTKKRTFYEIMPPNKPKTIKNISLGFMPDQGSSVSAEVIDYGIP